MRKSATTKSEKVIPNQESAGNYVMRNIFETKGIDKNIVMKPNKLTQFTDNTVEIEMKTGDIEDMIEQQCFSETGIVIQIDNLSLSLQLRLRCGWILCGASFVNQMVTYHTEYRYKQNSAEVNDSSQLSSSSARKSSKFDVLGVYDYLKQQKTCIGTTRKISLKFLKYPFPYVIRGWCRTINIESPTGNSTITEAVKTFSLKAFNKHPTLNGDQLRSMIMASFPSASEQILASTCNGLIGRLARKRKLNNDQVESKDELCLQYQELLIKKPQLKDQLSNVTSARALSLLDLGAYLFNREIEFSSKDGKTKLVELAGPTFKKLKALNHDQMIKVNATSINLNNKELYQRRQNHNLRIPHVNFQTRSIYTIDPDRLRVQSIMDRSITVVNASHKPSIKPRQNINSRIAQSQASVGRVKQQKAQRGKGKLLDGRKSGIVIHEPTTIRLWSLVQSEIEERLSQKGFVDLECDRVVFAEAQIWLMEQTYQQYRNNGDLLSIAWVRGDGACWYYAVIVSMMFQHKMKIFHGSALYLRICVISFMSSRPDLFEELYYNDDNNISNRCTPGTTFFGKNFQEYCQILLLNPGIFCDELQSSATSTFLQIDIIVEMFVSDRIGQDGDVFPAFEEVPREFKPVALSPTFLAHRSVTVLNNANAHYWGMNLDKRQGTVNIEWLPPNQTLQRVLSHLANSQVFLLVQRNRVFQDRSKCWGLTGVFVDRASTLPSVMDIDLFNELIANKSRQELDRGCNERVTLMLSEDYTGLFPFDPLNLDANVNVRVEGKHFRQLRDDKHVYNYETREHEDYQIGSHILDSFLGLCRSRDSSRCLLDSNKRPSVYFPSDLTRRLIELPIPGVFEDESYSFVNVSRWTRRCNIFAMDRVPIILHHPGHWSLIIIYPQLKEIHHYDHLNMSNGEKEMFSIFRWLSDVALKTLSNPTAQNPTVGELDPNEWLLQNRIHLIPQLARQRRGMACGLYVMKLIDYLDDGIPIEMADYVEDDFDHIYRRQVACYIERRTMGD